MNEQVSFWDRLKPFLLVAVIFLLVVTSPY